MLVSFVRPARIDREVRVQLGNPVTPRSIAVALSDVRRQARFLASARFAIDCSNAAALSAQELADLSRLHRDLRADGADLVLDHCGAALRAAVAASPYGGLLAGNVARHGAHALRGPHLARRSQLSN